MLVGRYSKVRVMGSIPGGIIIILSFIAFVTSILLSWGRGGVVLGVDEKFLFREKNIKILKNLEPVIL